MSTAYLPLKLPKRVSRKVRLLRWMVRLYVFLEGLALVAILLGLAFWGGLLLDWSFEPPVWLRALLITGVFLAAVFVAVKYLVSRSLAKLSNSNLGLLLERNYPELAESLVTTIEASDKNRNTPVGNRQLIENTSLKAAESMRGVRLMRVFKFRPLLWKLTAAVALVLSILAFSVWQTEAFGFWIDRIQLSESSWPRTVQLSLHGFEQQDNQWTVNVARDDNFDLVIHASIVEGHTAPDQVQIRYRYPDGRRGRYIMTKVGEALPGRDTAEQFRYTFKNISEDMEFDVVGGDDAIRGIQLHVVERPQIVRTTLECEYPAYMRRSARTIPFSGRVEIPEGTQAVCRVETNKVIEQVSVYDSTQQYELPVELNDSDGQSFSVNLNVGTQDLLLLVNMRDDEGVTNRDPYRISISAIKDTPPDVTARLLGIGTAVTSQALIPFEGSVLDQYGIEDVRFEYSVDQGEPRYRQTLRQPVGATEFTEFGALDLADTDQENQKLLELKPGQKLALAVQARDAYDLGEGPNIGSSQRFLLKVVTESELRAILEKRELGLRQRFEAIYEKMISIEELIKRIDVVKTSDDQAMPQEEKKRQDDRDRLRIGGALQNTTQLANETLGVAEGFEDIVQELENNRIVTEELKGRLVDGISLPLRDIGEELMPQLQKSIQELKSTYNEVDRAGDVHQQTVVQAEIVVEAMESVLDRMLELESYNELVELLRGIVNDHKQLQEKTKAERRKKLRSLLDDE